MLRFLVAKTVPWGFMLIYVETSYQGLMMLAAPQEIGENGFKLSDCILRTMAMYRPYVAEKASRRIVHVRVEENFLI